MPSPQGDQIVPIDQREAHLVGSECHCNPSKARDAETQRPVILHSVIVL